MDDFKPIVKSRDGMDPNPISPFSRALFIVKDEPTLKKYMDRFERERLDYIAKANLQNVILFSGALFDAFISRSEKKYQRYLEYALNVEKDITFVFNNYRLSFEMLLDFAQLLIQRERKKGYEMHDFIEEVVNRCKAHIDKLYKDYLANQ